MWSRRSTVLGKLEDLARQDRLYPSVILHGGAREERLAGALELARILLCESADRGREGCPCRHCRRIGPAGDEAAGFHPDVHVLERDRATVTSAEATRRLVRAAQMSPFEARGQVFVIAAAESLSEEAANALLKILEEPPVSAPRNFLLLCPAADRLLATLRSRSLSLYLGSVERPDAARVEKAATGLTRSLESFARSGSGAYLLAAARALEEAETWDDPRDGRPWAAAAAAALESYRRTGTKTERGAALLALAEDLLLAPETRVRGIQARRILEGLVARHLGVVSHES